MIFDIPCAGELIRAVGEVHLVTHTTSDNNGGFLFTVHGNPSKAYAIGLTSGTIYKAVGESHVADHVKAGEVFSWGNNMHFISKGSSINLQITDFLHFIVNENGEVKMSVERHTLECQ